MDQTSTQAESSIRFIGSAAASCTSDVIGLGRSGVETTINDRRKAAIVASSQLCLVTATIQCVYEPGIKFSRAEYARNFPKNTCRHQPEGAADRALSVLYDTGWIFVGRWFGASEPSRCQYSRHSPRRSNAAIGSAHLPELWKHRLAEPNCAWPRRSHQRTNPASAREDLADGYIRWQRHRPIVRSARGHPKALHRASFARVSSAQDDKAHGLGGAKAMRRSH